MDRALVCRSEEFLFFAESMYSALVQQQMTQTPRNHLRSGMSTKTAFGTWVWQVINYTIHKEDFSACFGNNSYIKADFN